METERQSERDRDTDRDREKDRERGEKEGRERGSKRGKTDRQTDRQTDREIERQRPTHFIGFGLVDPDSKVFSTRGEAEAVRGEIHCVDLILRLCQQTVNASTQAYQFLNKQFISDELIQ